MSEREEILVAYLLGELGDDERARLEARVESDPELARELEARRPLIARLSSLPGEAWEPADPPPLTLPVSDIPSGLPRETPDPRRGTSWMPRRWGLAAAATALVVVVAAALVIPGLGEDDGPTPGAGDRTIALSPIESGDPSASGSLVLEGDDTARLEASGLATSRGDFYEIWLIGDEDLVSLGSFRVGDSGRASLEVRVPPDAGAYESYDISLEPDDGDPGHSGDSVLRGPARI